MNLVAALLGLFVLKPVIKARLAIPRARVAPKPAYAEEEIREPRRAAGP